MNFGTPIEQVTRKDMLPISVQLPGTMPATAANYEVFFIALRPYEIMEVSEVHRVKGTEVDATTVNIERLSGTEALDAGDTVCVAGFNLLGTINTVVTKKTGDLQNRLLNTGDRLALKDVATTALTSVAGLTITLLLKPLGRGDYR